MSLKQTSVVRCDFVHKDGEQCTAERQVDKISSTEPMYHIVIEVTVIDAQGETQLVKQDMHACYWDLYYTLCGIHDQAKIDLESRKRLEEERLNMTRAVEILDEP